MRSVHPLFLSLLACVMFAGPARASLTYTYVTGLPSYSGTPGSVVSVQLFLQEQLTSPSTSLILSEKGLDSSGFSIIRSGSIPASPTLITAVSGDAAFTGPLSSNVAADGTAAKLSEGTGTSVSSGPQGTATGNTLLIPLGTLSLTVGALGSSTQFILSPGSSGFGPTLTFTHGDNLDVNSTSPAYSGGQTSNFTVSAVPEPASLTLLGILAGLALSARRRLNA